MLRGPTRLHTGEARRLWPPLAQAMACATLLSCNGCMTYTLWKGDLVEDSHQPSNQKPLAFYDAPERRDVLVRYDELSPWNDHPRPRAYFLNENERRIKSSKTPRFVALSAANGRRPIPVYREPGPSSEAASLPGACAIVADNGCSFTLVQTNGEVAGPFSLPVYKGAAGNLKLFLLMPATVAVDATIAGGIAGLIYASSKAGLPVPYIPSCWDP